PYDDRAPERGPEPRYVERQRQLACDPAGQPQQQPVDDKRDQAEREHVERAADDLDQRLERGVDDAEDQGHPEQRAAPRPAAGGRQLDSGHRPGRDAQGSRGDEHPKQEPHGPDITRSRREVSMYIEVRPWPRSGLGLGWGWAGDR